MSKKYGAAIEQSFRLRPRPLSRPRLSRRACLQLFLNSDFLIAFFVGGVVTYIAGVVAFLEFLVGFLISYFGGVVAIFAIIVPFLLSYVLTLFFGAVGTFIAFLLVGVSGIVYLSVNGFPVNGRDGGSD